MTRNAPSTEPVIDDALRGSLRERAERVLRRNDAGRWTRAAPDLYPHQWSWDAAFIAMGWAHIDLDRAYTELDSLFRGQWRSGMLPHIVFDPDAPETSYFPGPERWRCADTTEDAPRDPPTSGLCQPPVHSLVVGRILDIAHRRSGAERDAAATWAERIYPRLFAWHEYLATRRDPEDSGLLTIYHPWESGCDNSPRWDYLMGRLIVGDMPPYTRYDLRSVGDPSQRPSDHEYDFYVWLVERLKHARYDDGLIYDSHPFLVKDVLFSGLFVASNEALLALARVVSAPETHVERIVHWTVRGRAALRTRAVLGAGLCYDHDIWDGRPLLATTIAQVLAPLAAGGLAPEEVEQLIETLGSTDLAGHPGFAHPLPPSTSPHDPGFRPRSYWRGPTWPLVTWLVYWALRRAGAAERGAVFRAHALEQIAEYGFAEYFEPFSGRPLGSDGQSWTAAVVLDWLSDDFGPPGPHP